MDMYLLDSLLDNLLDNLLDSLLDNLLVMKVLNFHIITNTNLIWAVGFS